MFATAPTQDLAAFGGSRGGAHAFLDLVTRTGAGLTPSVTRAAHASRVRTLVDEHFNFVWRYLRGLGIPDAEADDAAQQVFMTVAAKIDAVQEGAERSFLVRTAHGVAANARRAVARRREVPGEHAVDDIADETPDAEERAQTGEALAILDRFLASLPDDLREVFILFENARGVDDGGHRGRSGPPAGDGGVAAAAWARGVSGDGEAALGRAGKGAEVVS